MDFILEHKSVFISIITNIITFLSDRKSGRVKKTLLYDMEN